MINPYIKFGEEKGIEFRKVVRTPDGLVQLLKPNPFYGLPEEKRGAESLWCEVGRKYNPRQLKSFLDSKKYVLIHGDEEEPAELLERLRELPITT